MRKKKAISGAGRMEAMSRYIFTAPRWPASLLILCILGFLIELLGNRINPDMVHFGLLGFILPGVISFFLTSLLVILVGGQMTWNRSALLAVSCTIFTIIITLIGLIILPGFTALCYGISLGFIFGLRLLILVSIADYRLHRMVLPALVQSLAGYAGGVLVFPDPFVLFVPIILLFFGIGFSVLIWLIDRPLYRAFRIRGLEFLNAFIAHLTDGSKNMEEFFRTIGVEAFVPQVSIFFKRAGKRDLILTIPNVHPGPMGEIGGGNLPAILKDKFSEEVMVTHGCATHDFNLVSESEIDRIVTAIDRTRSNLEYSPLAAPSWRIVVGSVSLLSQRIGDALLMVSTRSPEKTEDLDFCIGHAIMCEGHRVCRHIGFIDAHNRMGDEIDAILPGTRTAHEYFTAASGAMDRWEQVPLSGLKAGYAHLPLPFSRFEGIGDIGLQVLVCEVAGQRTAYVLIDGNNMVSGVREQIRDAVLGIVDEAEIMTTDTHVVNTISGKNPVGLRAPPDQLTAFVCNAVREAVRDLSDAEAAGSTASCEGIVIFGSDSIAQLASIVNTILVYVVPISAGMLLLAVLLSTIAYMVVA